MTLHSAYPNLWFQHNCLAQTLIASLCITSHFTVNHYTIAHYSELITSLYFLMTEHLSDELIYISCRQKIITKQLISEIYAPPLNY